MFIVFEISKMKSCVFLFSLGIFLVALLQDIHGIPSPRKVIEADGSTYNEDDCEDAAKDAERSGACAVIFEKTECDLPDLFFGTGDKMEIDEDKWTNLRGIGFHEDVESIIVKPGCVLFGYDENSKSERGTGISVSAVGKTDWVYRELDSEEFDLADDIEAVECYCGAKAQLATQVLPLQSSTFESAVSGFLNVFDIPTATRYCNLWIHAFNRLPVEKRPCAILFESEDCETSDGLLLKDWYLEILPKQGVVNLPELSTGAKADSAEAVLVRPGCTFTGYARDDGQGKEVTVSAPNNRRPTYYPLGSRFNPFKEQGLKEDIDSYRCTC